MSISAATPKTPPRVTVLMCVHDGEAHLRESIQSILLQSYKNYEFLIINDGSTDSSTAILDSLGDARVRVMHQNTMGWAASLTRGLEHSRGEFVAFMDSDDVSLPDRLETQLKYLDSHPEVALVCSRTSSIDSKSKPVADWHADRRNVTPEDIVSNLPLQNCIAYSSVMIRAKVLRRYRLSPRAGANLDYELWLRLVSGKQKINKLADPLLLLRADGRTQRDGLVAHVLALGWSLRKLRLGRFELRLARNILRELTTALGKLLERKKKDLGSS